MQVSFDFKGTKCRNTAISKLSVCWLYLVFVCCYSVAHRNYWMCIEDVDMARNDKLKAILNKYFDNQSMDLTEDDDVQPEPVSLLLYPGMDLIIRESPSLLILVFAD